MHNQHRSPDPTKIERATATSTVALFFIFLVNKMKYHSDIIGNEGADHLAHKAAVNQDSDISLTPATNPFYDLFWLSVPNKVGSHAEELRVLTNLQDKLKHTCTPTITLVKLTQIHCFTSSGKSCMIRLSAQHSPTLTHSNLMQSPLLKPNSVTNFGPCQM
jgi:hypothetical protein